MLPAVVVASFKADSHYAIVKVLMLFFCKLALRAAPAPSQLHLPSPLRPLTDSQAHCFSFAVAVAAACCQLPVAAVLLLLPDLCDNFSSTSTHMRSGFRMRAGYEPLLQPSFVVAVAVAVHVVYFACVFCRCNLFLCLRYMAGSNHLDGCSNL